MFKIGKKIYESAKLINKSGKPYLKRGIGEILMGCSVTPKQ